MLFWIAGIAFLILGVLAYIIMQMPDSPIKKRKKEKKGPPPEPPKDWQGIAERQEKRAHGLEAKLVEAEKVVRQKDKEVAEKKTALSELEQRYQQEQVWRQKEEDAVTKEKKREKLLEDELSKARDGLNNELTQRIRLDYEVKELRALKETLAGDTRRLSSHNMELERKVKIFSDDNRELKRENEQLKVKKEADQWVAKDDYIRVEKLLKRARWEVELFKRKFAEDLWPRELQMRRPQAPREEPAPASSVSPEVAGSSPESVKPSEAVNNNPAQPGPNV